MGQGSVKPETTYTAQNTRTLITTLRLKSSGERVGTARLFNTGVQVYLEKVFSCQLVEEYT